MFNQLGVIDFKKRELNFESLVKIIISQQLSNKSADMIFFRFKSLFNNERINAHSLLDVDFIKLKETGISKYKVNYILSLSKKIIKDPLLLHSWNNLNDYEAKSEIQKLKGFGNWSSDIVLLFYLGRKDVFPIGDSTLIKAVEKLYGLDISKDISCLDWAKPFRGILAIYLWEWVDNGMKKIIK